MNVGLVTSSSRAAPNALTIPFVSVVFPLPKSPSEQHQYRCLQLRGKLPAPRDRFLRRICNDLFSHRCNLLAKVPAARTATRAPHRRPRFPMDQRLPPTCQPPPAMKPQRPAPAPATNPRSSKLSGKRRKNPRQHIARAAFRQPGIPRGINKDLSRPATQESCEIPSA